MIFSISRAHTQFPQNRSATVSLVSAINHPGRRDDQYNFGPGSYIYACLRSVVESHKIEVRATNREAGRTVSDRNFNPSRHLDYLENDFIVPGPGAQEGIKKCFVNPKKVSEKEIIERVTVFQNQCSGAVLGHGAPTLFGRSLQLIDLQNCFCEIAKYSRVVHPEFNLERARIKTLYIPDPAKVRDLPRPFFPPKWEINAICNRFLGEPTLAAYRP